MKAAGLLRARRVFNTSAIPLTLERSTFQRFCPLGIFDRVLPAQRTVDMHYDDAFDFLIERLAAVPGWKGHMGSSARTATYGCDVWVPQIVQAYWQPRITSFTIDSLGDEHFRPFYDAAWELARIGVLRPGANMPRGVGMGGQLFTGDGFSITQFGREWLRDASSRPIRDPSRLAEVLQGFGTRFGQGYAQRATEAAKTYRTANYLACCVMAGAAAESILLAIAIAKVKDEA